MMTRNFNLPTGTIARDISPPTICNVCGEAIAVDENGECEECAAEELEDED